MHYVKLAIAKYCWSHTELHLALPCDEGGAGQSWESLGDLNTSCPEAVGFLVPGCHPSGPSGSLLERSRLPSNLVSALRYKYLGKGKVVAAAITGSCIGGDKVIHPWWQLRLLYDRAEKSPGHTTTSQDSSPPVPTAQFPSFCWRFYSSLSLWVSHLELPCAEDDLWLLILRPLPPACYCYECVWPHPAFMWQWGWNEGLCVCKANTPPTERHSQLSWHSLVFSVCCKVPSSGCHFGFPCSVFWAEARRMSAGEQKYTEKQSKGHWTLPQSDHGQFSFCFFI